MSAGNVYKCANGIAYEPRKKYGNQKYNSHLLFKIAL